MTAYVTPEAFDADAAFAAASDYIKNHANQMLAVIAYAKGNSYATVTAPSNVIASVAMTPADFDIASGVMSSAVKNTLASRAGDPTHIVFVDTTASKVLWVAEDTSSGAAAVNTPTQFPACSFSVGVAAV